MSYEHGASVTNLTMNPHSQPSRHALADLHDSAYRWALACCGYRQETAREVMQMVYVEILGGRAVFDGRSTLKTWLFAVVRNVALRYAAAEARAQALQEALRRQAQEPADDGGDALVRGEARAAIRAALKTLSPQQRQVIELVYFHELTVAESAAVLGIGVGAARQHFHRAKRALAAALAPLKEANGAH